MTAEPIVRVDGLYKTFTRGSERIDVLIDLNVEVERAEFLALMGPSGSGKTTLLNLIAGLDQPTTGSIHVGDQEISAMSESQLARWRTRHVGFVFQFFNLLPVLTAYENVELPLLLLDMTNAERKKQVELSLDLVGLADRMRHRPGMLSGGQQQRVGIARAMVTDPTLIVADEPTGALDAKSADDVLNLLNLLREQLGKTIIMVTHDPKAADRAQRVLHLEKGRLVNDVARTPRGPAFPGAFAVGRD
jgi:putative ABC transport system ATP-binding protein